MSGSGKKRNASAQARDWSKARIIFLGALLALVWSGLWARGFYIQILRGPALAVQASSQHWGQESVYGQRGEIFDRNGELLAKSVRVKSVFARPSKIDNLSDTAKILQDILGGSRSQWLNRLQSRAGFVWLKRQISDQTAARLQASGLSGVFLTEEQSRFYPQGHLAGQLLGFVGIDNHGLEGLELSLDAHLSGEKHSFVVQRDAAGHILYAPGQFLGDWAGDNLHLTLDSQIQYAAEVALDRTVDKYKAKSGTCLVVDVESGEILAWAQTPLFNPNAYQVSSPRLWRNRLAVDEFEPGSTLKPVMVASALEHNVVDAQSIYFCENGKWRYKGRTVKDTHEYAWLSVSRIIRYSSNIGAGKIGLDLGEKRYYDTLRSLGLGQKTGLPLPAENNGILRTPEQWNEVDLVSASFGQSLAMTGLQLAQAYLCLSSKGLWRPLRLIKNPVQDRPPVRRVFSSSTAQQVLRMLHDVVQEDGTGTQARIPGIRVGGKTGTAQKASPGGGYGRKYVASFVGIFPALQPRYLVVAVVDEPSPQHYGGIVAAPVVRAVGKELVAWSGMPKTLEGHQAQDQENKEKHSLRARIQAQTPDSTHNLKSGQTVPDLYGLPLRKALEMLAEYGVMPKLEGQGVVVTKQSPAPESDPGDVREREWILWLSDTLGQEEAS
ncbi:MAG: penicillin-binding protein [Desulfovermiculus sp.]|nr:penicillin-binding protein [Desulfovermiculus sp.]